MPKILFEPSDNQKKYLLAYLDPDIKDTDKARAEYVGIKGQAIVQWKQNPDFRYWLSKELTKWTESLIGQIHRKIVKKALSGKGSDPMLKLYLERFDKYYTPTKKILTGTAKDIKEDLDKLDAEDEDIRENL